MSLNAEMLYMERMIILINIFVVVHANPSSEMTRQRWERENNYTAPRGENKTKIYTSILRSGMRYIQEWTNDLMSESPQYGLSEHGDTILAIIHFQIENHHHHNDFQVREMMVFVVNLNY